MFGAARTTWRVVSKAESWFPSGTRMVFDNDTAPVGWVRDTTTANDSVIRLVTGARADAGSWTISGLTHAHTHTIPISGYGTIADTGATGEMGVDSTTIANTVQASGAASTAAVSSDGTWRPVHRDMILASKS